MPPVSQQDVTTKSTRPSTPAALGDQLAAVANTRTGIAAPTTNTTTGEVDYTARQSALTNKDASGLKKVALVGRYGGAGTTNTWGDATQASAKGGTPTFSTVVFKVTPNLSESGSVLAVDIGEIRSAGSVIVYLGSPARTFNISATFVSRTTAEATQTWTDINILKAWRMPTSNSDEPETIRLYAYDKSLKGIPCLLQNIQVDWADDVDYIEASNGSPIPIIQKVSITLKEVRNWDDINKFDYEQFKQGTLDQW